MNAAAPNAVAPSGVALTVDQRLTYPQHPPFGPPVAYPELGALAGPLDPSNQVYPAVRDLLLRLGLDAAHAGTPAWNPFAELVAPGDRVVIKPNLVLHYHERGHTLDAILTHGSVVRPLIDYALRALGGRGQVTVGDAPHGNADFAAITQANGLGGVMSWFLSGGHPVRMADFRKFEYGLGPRGFIDGLCREVNRDPTGYTIVDFGWDSYLERLAGLDRLYGSDYDRSFITRQHRHGRHRYLLSRTVLEADLVIGVPKLKTHKKTGVTLNLKNLVGINGDKNFLAHYRIGSPSEDGDEFPDDPSPWLKLARRWDRWCADQFLAPNHDRGRRLHRFLHLPSAAYRRLHLRRTGRPLVYGGNWHGNNTAWRMCLDLNRALLLADAEGVLRPRARRRFFSVVDGIVAGEGDGPMEPDPRACGLLAAGADPVAVDQACTWVAGFDPDRLPLLRAALADPDLGRHAASARMDVRVDGAPRDLDEVNLRFRPHRHWIGTMERA